MSQHDLDIANQTASNARADINNALKALATLSSGTTAPPNTYANMLWYDTGNNILKMRSKADDAWINVGYIDQSNNEFKPYVGGTQVDTQSTATWEAGTSTTESLVSPAKVKAAIEALVPSSDEGIGVGQTWVDGLASRVVGTPYQNTTGKPIFVVIYTGAGSGSDVEVSETSSTGPWKSVSRGQTIDSAERNFACFIVPEGHYYRVTAGTIRNWSELR